MFRDTRGRRSRTCMRAAVGFAVAAGLSACGSPGTPVGARIGAGFYAAVKAADWKAACGFLAPETQAELEKSAGRSCPAALAEEDLPDPGPQNGVSAFGTMTQVRFADDTLFLARFQSGWRVLAAGCAPVPGHPYDCRLQGG
jgi:hypothetical protein